MSRKSADGSDKATTAKAEDVVMMHLIVWTVVITFSALFFLSFVVGMYQNRNMIKAGWRRRGAEIKDGIRFLLWSFIWEDLLGKQYFGFSPVFASRSVAEFNIRYKLDLVSERLTPEGDPGLVKVPVRQIVEERYHQTAFLPFLKSRVYAFRIIWRKAASAGNGDDIFDLTPGRFIEKNGRRLFLDLTNAEFVEELKAIPFMNKGRKVSVQEFLPGPFLDELIKENYAMLKDEEKEEIGKDESYVAYEERLAVAALKRRLEFQRAQSRQSHDSSMISILTERAGGRLRISWQFKPAAPQGYDLLGYRRTGGFFADQWDENNNGTLVIHGRRGGAVEAIEPLQEGETYYYTFILKPWVADAKSPKYAIARFQMTITADETELIKSLLQRFEERTKPDPDREHIARALKEVNLAVEYHEEIEEMKKSLQGKIRRKNLSPEEEARQIEIIDDLVNTARSKYDI